MIKKSTYSIRLKQCPKKNTFSDCYLPLPLLWHTLQSFNNSLSWVLTTYDFRKLMVRHSLTKGLSNM